VLGPTANDGLPREPKYLQSTGATGDEQLRSHEDIIIIIIWVSRTATKKLIEESDRPNGPIRAAGGRGRVGGQANDLIGPAGRRRGGNAQSPPRPAITEELITCGAGLGGESGCGRGQVRRRQSSRRGRPYSLARRHGPQIRAAAPASTPPLHPKSFCKGGRCDPGGC